MEVDLSVLYMTHPESQTQTHIDQLPYEPRSQRYQPNNKTLAPINLTEQDNAKSIYSNVLPIVQILGSDKNQNCDASSDDALITRNLDTLQSIMDVDLSLPYCSIPKAELNNDIRIIVERQLQ